jgi:Fe-S cluster assembly protein SufD
MSAARPVPGSMSNAAYEQRLRDAVMDAAPLLNARLLPVNVRSGALNKALAAGLPQLRNDLWKYADLKFLASAALAPVGGESAEVLAERVRALLPPALTGLTRLVFADGRLIPALSDPCPALDAATAPLVPERTRHERFGWLNDAFATDVARLNVKDAAQLEVIFVATPGNTRQAVYPRLELDVAANAQVTVVERHLGSTGEQGLINAAVQVHAASGSQVEHLRWQSLDADAQFLDTVQVALAGNAHYKLTQVQLGARTARCSLRVSMYGAGADFALSGVSVAAGRRTLDNSLLVDHLAPQTRSAQLFRAIARDGAHIACRSRVEVNRTARASESSQSLKGLLAGTGSEIDLRPQLEIFTDEVRASHGATTGALDENMRFYLASRGLDADTARALLEWAFLEDALRELGQPGLRTAAEHALATALGSDVARQVLA